MSGQDLQHYKMSYDELEEHQNLGSSLGDGSIGLSDLSAFGSTPNSYANYRESFRSSGNMNYSISPYASPTTSQLQKPSFSYDTGVESAVVSPERGPRNSIVSDASEFGKSSLQSLDRNRHVKADYQGAKVPHVDTYPVSRYDLTIPSRVYSESLGSDDVIYSMPYKYTGLVDNTVLSPQLSPMQKVESDLTVDYLMDTFAIDNSKDEKDYIACTDNYVLPDKPLQITKGIKNELKLGNRIQTVHNKQIETSPLSEEFRNIYQNRLNELKDDLKARFEHYKIMLQNADIQNSRSIYEMTDLLKSERDKETHIDSNRDVKKRHHSYDTRPIHEVSSTQTQKKHRCRHKHRRSNASKHHERSSGNTTKKDLETSMVINNVSREVCTSPKVVKNSATSPTATYKCDRATSPIMWNQMDMTKPALPHRPKLEDFEDKHSNSSITSDLKQLEDLPSLSSRVNSVEERRFRPPSLSITHRNRLSSALSTSFTGATPQSYKNNLSLGRTYELSSFSPDSQLNSSLDRSQELVVHACTPPRPVLKSEANTAIYCELSRKGSEFSIIHGIFAKENKRVAKIVKTFTYKLHKDFLGEGHDSSDCFMLNRSFEFNELSLLFYTSTSTNLDIVISSPIGFSSLQKIHNANLVFSSSINTIESLSRLTIKPASLTLKCLLALVSLGNCHKSDSQYVSVTRVDPPYDSIHYKKEDIYLLKEATRAVPSYLIEYYEN